MTDTVRKAEGPFNGDEIRDSTKNVQQLLASKLKHGHIHQDAVRKGGRDDSATASSFGNIRLVTAFGAQGMREVGITWSTMRNRKPRKSSHPILVKALTERDKHNAFREHKRVQIEELEECYDFREGFSRQRSFGNYAKGDNSGQRVRHKRAEYFSSLTMVYPTICLTNKLTWLGASK